MASTKTGFTRKATRAINRAEIIDNNFVRFCEQWDGDAVEKPADDALLREDRQLVAGEFREMFESMIASRHLDLEARAMRLRGEGFYTIGSSGHEVNAVLGRLTRGDDPAFLHYRSGAFMQERARKFNGDAIYDTALSLAASAEDPVSGGRHKVWGSRKMWVPPQTSTIASHLPKAMGTAVAIAQAKRSGIPLPFADDAIVICSFGDASINHASAQSAFNSAQWTAYQRLPCPVLFVCEDNDIGISVMTPTGWVETSFCNRPGLRYFRADGLDLVAAYETTMTAIDYARLQRAPVFLHLKMVRLMGHAGTDAETEYRSLADIEATEACDPLLLNAETALENGIYSAEELLATYEAMRERVREAARKATATEKLRSAAAVMRPLAQYHEKAVNSEAKRTADKAERLAVFGDEENLPEHQAARHMSININRALHDLMIKYPEMTLFGEDVAQKGGVYTVTSGLYRNIKGYRVFNTLLDETTILGMAQGAAMVGMLPFPEIQYLAYFHNACDQLRGEACSLQFFSNAQYSNGMVLRIASLAYQKGFGGHFHNDNSFAALRDIPGLIVACPARGDDAVKMLRTCAALAKINGRVVAFLEPIALYMTKDLYENRDNKWVFDYPAPGSNISLGEGRIYNPEAGDLLIVTYGNGVPMSLRAARQIESDTGWKTRILDLRWLKPLNREWIAKHASECGKVLVVDEGRRTGGIAEEIFTLLDEYCKEPLVKTRVAGEDSYVPLADAANLVLVQEEDIIRTSKKLLY